MGQPAWSSGLRVLGLLLGFKIYLSICIISIYTYIDIDIDIDIAREREREDPEAVTVIPRDCIRS